MHIYAFGSLCRGEVEVGSDVDMLAITEDFDPRFDAEVFSIYLQRRIRKLWEGGNPFAWHLATEAKLIFASDGRDFIAELGKPAAYEHCAHDCQKFLNVYEHAILALKSGECSLVFELSAIFLAVRNFATCFSLGVTNSTNFSRHSARRLGSRSLNISDEAYQLLERARILSTRASGAMIRRENLEACLDEVCAIASWMNKLLTEIPRHGRVQ